MRFKCLVDAQKECIDLLNNGYIRLFTTVMNDGIFSKYRHRENGRTLSVRIYRDYWELKENGKLLKSIDYA